MNTEKAQPSTPTNAASFINSPFADCKAQLKSEKVVLAYKGQEYTVTRSYYRCLGTDADFVTPEQHDEVLRQLRSKSTN